MDMSEHFSDESLNQFYSIFSTWNLILVLTPSFPWLSQNHKKPNLLKTRVGKTVWATVFRNLHLRSRSWMKICWLQRRTRMGTTVCHETTCQRKTATVDPVHKSATVIPLKITKSMDRNTNRESFKMAINCSKTKFSAVPNFKFCSSNIQYLFRINKITTNRLVAFISRNLSFRKFQNFRTLKKGAKKTRDCALAIWRRSRGTFMKMKM